MRMITRAVSKRAVADDIRTPQKIAGVDPAVVTAVMDAARPRGLMSWVSREAQPALAETEKAINSLTYTYLDWFARDDGQTGNGVTDDTDVLRSAVDAGAGGVVIFGAGKSYVWTRADLPLTLASGTTIDLNGSTITCPEFDTGEAGSAVVTAYNTYGIFSIAGVSNCEIRNGTLVGHQTTTGGNARCTYGIVVGDQVGAGSVGSPSAPYVATSNVRLRDLHLSRFWHDGFFVAGDVSDFIAENVTSVNNRRSGASVVGGRRFFFLGGEYGNNGDATGDAAQDPEAGIDFESEDIGGVDTIEDVTIDGAYVHDQAKGIIVQKGSTGERVDGLTIRRVTATTHTVGLTLSGVDRFAIEDCRISDITEAVVEGGGPAAIAIADSCTDGVIARNKAWNVSRGLYCTTAENVTVVANQFEGRFALRNSQSFLAVGNTLAMTGHGFLTAQAVFVSPTATIPVALTEGTPYYVIVVSANAISLAASPADAHAGTAIVLGAGSGTCVASGSDHDGIGLYHSTTDISRSLTVAENEISGFQGAGIAVGKSSGVKSVGNHCHDNGRNGFEWTSSVAIVSSADVGSGNGRELASTYSEAYVDLSHRAQVLGFVARKHDRYESGTAVATTNADQVTLEVATPTYAINYFGNSVSSVPYGTPIIITGGAGAGSTSLINSYDPATRVCQCNNFGASPPGAGDTYEMRWPNTAVASITVTSGTQDVLLDGYDIGKSVAIVDAGTRTRCRSLNPSSYAAGDTTPSVRGVHDLHITNGAGTTVTTLDDGYEGQVVVCTFADANTTFSHGGSFRTATGADVTYAAGAGVAYKKVGALWWQVAASVVAS
jgi:hypothetical protein